MPKLINYLIFREETFSILENQIFNSICHISDEKKPRKAHSPKKDVGNSCLVKLEEKIYDLFADNILFLKSELKNLHVFEVTVLLRLLQDKLIGA